MHLRPAPRHEPAPHRVHLLEDHRAARPQLPVRAPHAAHDGLARPVHRVRAEGLLLRPHPRRHAGSGLRSDVPPRSRRAAAACLGAGDLVDDARHEGGPRGVSPSSRPGGRASAFAPARRSPTPRPEPLRCTSSTPRTHTTSSSLSGLGHALDKRPRGLATDGRLSYPMHGMEAARKRSQGSRSSWSDAERRPSPSSARGTSPPLVRTSTWPSCRCSWTTGPSSPEPRRSSTSVPRGALGLDPEGRIVIARGMFASDAPLVDALVRAGCRRAVALDRGARAPPFLLRVGTEHATARSFGRDCALRAVRADEARAPFASSRDRGRPGGAYEVGP